LSSSNFSPLFHSDCSALHRFTVATIAYFGDNQQLAEDQEVFTMQLLMDLASFLKCYGFKPGREDLGVENYFFSIED
jgi:hypothetical protein